MKYQKIGLTLHKTFKISLLQTEQSPHVHKKNMVLILRTVWFEFEAYLTNLNFWILKQLLRKQLAVCIILKSEKLAKTTFYWRTNKSSY